jgi:large subunit ribosomal protein L4
VSTKTLKVDLPAEIFDVQVNIPLIHQVVVAQQAAARQGSASTKRRGEVRGGGRKPYKQKGTGRARQGSIRAPQFTGGGVVHGPAPRSYDQRTPKKMKAAALRGALSDRARNDRIHVVEALVTGDKPSTKTALSALSGVADRRKFLVVLERTDAVTWLSLRNAPEVHIVAVDQLNTYDVLAADDVVFTRGAYDTFVAWAARGKVAASVAAEPETKKVDEQAEPEAKKEKVQKEKAQKVAKKEKAAKVADSQDAEVAEEFAGGMPAGPDGEAPEGYEIKGNKDSMKYHAPGGRWYDTTVAELWFKTEADAQAAGFVKAGSRASKAENEKEADK